MPTELVGLTDVFPQRWAEFRRSRLNTLVMRLRTLAKARRPGLTLSAAVYPDPRRRWLDGCRTGGCGSTIS